MPPADVTTIASSVNLNSLSSTITTIGTEEGGGPSLEQPPIYTSTTLHDNLLDSSETEQTSSQMWSGQQQGKCTTVLCKLFCNFVAFIVLVEAHSLFIFVYNVICMPKTFLSPFLFSLQLIEVTCSHFITLDSSILLEGSVPEHAIESAVVHEEVELLTNTTQQDLSGN